MTDVLSPLTRPIRRATRYAVTLTSGDQFIVTVQPGSVPAERIRAMTAHHETIRTVTRDCPTCGALDAPIDQSCGCFDNAGQ